MRIEGLSFAYGDKTVFKDLDLASESSVICLMGPSGCGKTTLLHILAGILPPSSGKVDFPKSVSVMFQEDRLLGWLNAYENVALVLGGRLSRFNGQNDKATELLRKLDIDPAMKIKSMSGGMKRRVALARALALESDALLLDEPFKGLDEDLMRRCASIVRSCNKVTVVSTHSMEEAQALGAEVIRLE